MNAHPLNPENSRNICCFMPCLFYSQIRQQSPRVRNQSFFASIQPKLQPARVWAIARGVCNAGGGWRPGRSGTHCLRRLFPVCPLRGNDLSVYPRARGHNGASPRRVLFQAVLWWMLPAIFRIALFFRFEMLGYLSRVLQLCWIQRRLCRRQGLTQRRKDAKNSAGHIKTTKTVWFPIRYTSSNTYRALDQKLY